MQHRPRLTRSRVNEVIELDVYKSETINELKEKIELRTSIPSQRQKLYKYNLEPELNGYVTLRDSGINDYYNLTLIVV